MAPLPEQFVSKAEELRACCEQLAQCPVFGLDTEFVGEDTYHPRLCLVQVATRERLFLIDPLSAGPLDEFWKLVIDPAHQVIVHAGRQEVRLCQLWTGHAPGNLFDLQIAAGLCGLVYPLGHAALVSHFLGVQLTKGETLTDWRLRPLSEQQIRYAYDDVVHLLPLYDILSRQLRETGRTEWAREEFNRLVTTATSEEPLQEKWRKLRGLGALDRRRLAIVRELFRWREEVAAKTNRPARTIVRDDLLIEIARKNPHREADLQLVRGLARRDLSSILQAVKAARALPLEECPTSQGREQDAPQTTLITSILTAVLGDFCARRHLAANLVASTHEVKLIVRARVQGHELPTDALLTQGWRGSEVLPVLLAVLDGKRSLRITDVASETPFAVEDLPERTSDAYRV